MYSLTGFWSSSWLQPDSCKCRDGTDAQVTAPLPPRQETCAEFLVNPDPVQVLNQHTGVPSVAFSCLPDLQVIKWKRNKKFKEVKESKKEVEKFSDSIQIETEISPPQISE